MSKKTAPQSKPIRYVNYEAIATALFAAAEDTREANQPHYPALNGSVKMGNSEHLDFYAIGFRGPRQSGKTRWAASQLSPTTMVVTSNKLYREDMLDRATRSEHENRATPAPPLTKYNRPSLEEQVVTWRDCLTDLAKGPSEKRHEVLSQITRVIVDGASYMDISLQRLAEWSRLGGQVPALAFID